MKWHHFPLQKGHSGFKSWRACQTKLIAKRISLFNNHVMKKIIVTVVVVGAVGILAIGILGYKADKDFFLPPGCRKSLFLGGCFSTNVTKELRYTNVPSCLEVSNNDCTYASIQLYNTCEGKVTVEGNEIGPNYNYLVFTLNPDGKPQLINTKDRNLPKNPENDEKIVLTGSYNNKNFEISYTRTRSLCDQKGATVK